jgi:DNA polymerase IV
VCALLPQVEDRGIDEIYVDLTDALSAQIDGGRTWALQLKAAIHAATGLTCSVSVSPNKLLSKIGSYLQKPDGLTLLTQADVATRIWPLAATKVNGIGPNPAARLAAHGLHTIGNVAMAKPQWLLTHFGVSCGRWLHEAAHGRDTRAVVSHREPKSISRETTFERDLHAVPDCAELGQIFTELCTRLANDLARKGYVSRTIGIKLRFDDFCVITRDLSLPAPTQDAQAIRRAAGACLKRVDLTRKMRLLGGACGDAGRTGWVAELVVV